jgi:hypothetical protein
MLEKKKNIIYEWLLVTSAEIIAGEEAGIQDLTKFIDKLISHVDKGFDVTIESCSIKLQRILREKMNEISNVQQGISFSAEIPEKSSKKI